MRTVQCPVYTRISERVDVSSEMERQNFDTETFIDEIEKRPAIWDMESSDYANRIVKRRAWEELVLLFADKDDSEEKKKEIGNTLQKKWKGLRDTFVREMKKQKNAPSGSGSSKCNYVYFQRLLFLEKSVRNKPTESNFADTSETSQTGHNELESTADGREDIMKPPSQNVKKRKMSAADTEFLNIIKNTIGSRNHQQPQSPYVTDGDDEKLFCLSLHKELLKVPEVNRLPVKIEIMKMLQQAQKSSQPTACSSDSYSFDNYSSSSHGSSVSSVSVPVRPWYHAQISRSNEVAFHEYNPATPSLTLWQDRNSTSTPSTPHAALYATSPSTSSQDSQDSECLQLFPSTAIH